MLKKKASIEKNNETEILKDQLARALADYDNFKKRIEKRENELKYIFVGQVVNRLLSVFDMLYEAHNHLNDPGLALTIKELEDTLKAEGIEKISPKTGEEFDENLHEAVEVVKNEELKDGQIADCALVGWKFLTGPVIRHAKVVVNKLTN